MGEDAYTLNPHNLSAHYDDYFDDSDAVFASVVEFMGRYYIPTLVLLGLIGNTLSLIVFLGTYLNRLSLSVYLAALAVSDNGFLFALAIGWLDYLDLPLFHTNGWCQSLVYISYVTSFLSVWFTVSLTVERYIAICHPLRRPEMCTVRRAKYVVSTLSFFGLSVYAVSIWTSGIEQIVQLGIPICVPFKDFLVIHHVMIYVDTLVTLIVPFTAILILNIAITHRIAYFYSKKSPATIKIRFADGHRHNRANVCFGSKAQVKMTKMLLVISSVFLIVNSPSYVIRLRLFVEQFTQISRKTSRHDALVQQISQFLFYLSFSINFFLYNIFSKKFREALCRMFGKMKYKFTNFLQRGYRILRGSSTPDTMLNELRTVKADAAYK